MVEETSLIACRYCDAIYTRPIVSAYEKIVCHQCNSTIFRPTGNLNHAFIYALTAVILFLIANTLPFITLTLQGSDTTVSILSSVRSLLDNKFYVLSIIVTLFIFVIPLWYLLAILWFIVSFRFNMSRHRSQSSLFYLTLISPWNMLEVYLISVIVTLVKIAQIATVHFDEGFWALTALILCLVMISIHFNINALISDITHLKKANDIQ